VIFEYFSIEYEKSMESQSEQWHWKMFSSMVLLMKKEF